MESTCDSAVVVRNALSNPQVGQSFIEVEIESAETLQHMFAAYGSDLKSWLKDAQINHDYNLRLQYLAGLTPDGQIEQKMIDKIAGATAVDSLSASRGE